MTWRGNCTEDYSTFNFKFTTSVNGVPTTLAGTPALSVYKANDVTQSTAGITLTADFDSVTGLNNVLIDLSADAFYAVANDYQVVITTGTVSGSSVVGHVVGEFTIESRFDEADVTQFSGNAVVISGGLPDVNIASTDDIDLSATQKASVNTEADTALTDYDAATGTEVAALNDIAAADVWAVDATSQQTQGTFGQAIGDPVADTTTIYQAVATDAAGDNVAVDVIAVKAETALIVADTNELQTDDIPGSISALNDIAAADVWAVDATSQQTQGTFGQAIGDPVADTTTIYQSVATDAAGDNVAIDVIAVKAETAAIVNDTDLIDDGTSGLAKIATDVAAVLVDTNELQTDWVDGGRLDLIIDAIVADTNELQSDDVPGLIAALNNLDADGVWDEAMTETTGAPAVTASFREALKWMFALSRNKLTETATTTTLRNDADAADLSTSTVSDDATTYIRGEWST